jgi:hypothetical protein
VSTTFQYKGYQVEIDGDPSAPLSIMVDGKDYTPLWNGSDSEWCAATWIKGHLDAQLRSRSEFQMRDQEMANAAHGWKPEAIRDSGQTVLSARSKQVLVRIAYCCWYIGSPVLWLMITNPFERDLYNANPYLWRE